VWELTGERKKKYLRGGGQNLGGKTIKESFRKGEFGSLSFVGAPTEKKGRWEKSEGRGRGK